jgi:hypothetical protein
MDAGGHQSPPKSPTRPLVHEFLPGFGRQSLRDECAAGALRRAVVKLNEHARARKSSKISLSASSDSFEYEDVAIVFTRGSEVTSDSLSGRFRTAAQYYRLGAI